MKTDKGFASYTIPPKSMLASCILEVLKNHSDAQHRLSQKKIIYYLSKDFSFNPNRTTIKAHLMNLIDFGYTEIKYTEIKKADTKICSDWYWKRLLTDEEVEIIISSLIVAAKLPKDECNLLAEKLLPALKKL